MNNGNDSRTSLDAALRMYQVVWAVGEPVHAFNLAKDLLVEIEKDKNIEVKVWTQATGSANEWGTRHKPGSMGELINDLLGHPAVVALAEGLRLDGNLQSAALRVIADDRRAVFVSSAEPPDNFLQDYLKVVHIEGSGDLERIVADNCEANTRDFDENMIPPLVGLRPYRATSTLIEAIYHTDEGEEVPFLVNARKDSVFSDSGGVITLEEPEESYEELIGLERAKKLLESLAEKVRDNPVRGALLLGIPGTGKTAIARATARETGRPLYVFDLGAAFGGIVGASEGNTRRALRTLRNLPNGIVLFDELEKALAGSSSSGRTDSGVSVRVGGYVLQYLNDPRASKGFHLILGTSNDVTALPPEFTRAGRWDALFWFGMPPIKTLKKILTLYRNKFGLPKEFGKGADLKGMTGSEVEATCRIASILETKAWDDARVFVPILSEFRYEEVESLEAWAKGRAVSADEDNEIGIEGTTKIRK